MKLVALIFLLSTLLACSSGETKTKAGIFERKQIDSTQLMIKYKYIINDQQYTDSATIDNTVLPNDTITVKVKKDSPFKGSPDL